MLNSINLKRYNVADNINHLTVNNAAATLVNFYARELNNNGIKSFAPLNVSEITSRLHSQMSKAHNFQTAVSVVNDSIFAALKNYVAYTMITNKAKEVDDNVISVEFTVDD